MCGLIARFGSPDASPFPLARILPTIAHRGPDARGAVAWDDGMAPVSVSPDANLRQAHLLAHVRLAIIDLDHHADQPFRSADGRYYLAYNGEIYNYVELRGELESKGVRFRTSSDTEVLLEAWRAWGPEALPRLEGMFAFVLYDQASGTAFAARDPFGIKPLFIWEGDQEIVLASELHPLLQRMADAKLHQRSVAQALRWGMNDGFEETIVEGIRRVPPGTWLEIDTRERKVSDCRKYFDLSDIEQRDWDFADAKAQLRETFVSSVERHMRSDAPLGFALSGGINSSAIVCAAKIWESATSSRSPTSPPIVGFPNENGSI